MSDSLRPHRLQHTRLPCPSLTCRVCSTPVHCWLMPSSHLILCHPLLLLPSIFPSIRVFTNESVLPIRGPKYLSFSFSISSSNEYLGLISIRIDWLDLLAVQGTLPVCCYTSSSNCCFLTCIQISQEAGHVVWYSHLLMGTKY